MEELIEGAARSIAASVSLKCLCVAVFILFLGVYGRKTVWLFKAFSLDLRDLVIFGRSGEFTKVLPQDITNLLYVICACIGYVFGSQFGYAVIFFACIGLLILGPLLVRLRQAYLMYRNYEFPAVKIISLVEDYRCLPQSIGAVLFVELMGLVGYLAGFLFLRSFYITV